MEDAEREILKHMRGDVEDETIDILDISELELYRNPPQQTTNTVNKQKIMGGVGTSNISGNSGVSSFFPGSSVSGVSSVNGSNVAVGTKIVIPSRKMAEKPTQPKAINNHIPAPNLPNNVPLISNPISTPAPTPASIPIPTPIIPTSIPSQEADRVLKRKLKKEKKEKRKEKKKKKEKRLAEKAVPTPPPSTAIPESPSNSAPIPINSMPHLFGQQPAITQSFASTLPTTPGSLKIKLPIPFAQQSDISPLPQNEISPPPVFANSPLIVSSPLIISPQQPNTPNNQMSPSILSPLEPFISQTVLSPEISLSMLESKTNDLDNNSQGIFHLFI
jgi:hypothetical protein